jgi:N-methylhydantoinase A
MQRIGIDTGGTFSDFVLLDAAGIVLRRAKVPSTPSDPSLAVASGLAELAAQGELDVDRIVVGTTVATNAVIERRGPRVLFITNSGFTDVPFIGRMDKERLYDLHWQKPKPLVRRRDCFGVGGRLAHDGSELESVGPASLAALKERIAEASADANGEGVVAAVCLLFSYASGQHEQLVADAVIEALPDGSPLSLSHEVSPIWREYERASTTIADAFVKPVVDGYVTGVGSVIREHSSAERWNMLASNGGYLGADQARLRPAQLLLSGLAGGVIGAAFHARQAEHDAVFSLDMGGTSCDIGLVVDGEQQYATQFNLAFGLPVSIPCVSVQTIGAGGGSIAWVDRGGLLHVGPRSAGAEPGPAAYGKGGDEPTVTDANLVLGRLDPGYFLGGTVPLDAELAAESVARVGAEIDLDKAQAALAITRSADENMANAIRLVAVERGLDPREFALMAFGGAGPLHARAVAERLEMDTVLIPPHPGLCSAFGVAIATARVDRMKTFSARSGAVDLRRLAAAERELRTDAVLELAASVGDDAEPRITRGAAMRYEGQNYELEVEIPDGELDDGGWQALLERFEVEHERQYGFALPGEPVELINLRATAFLDEGSISSGRPEVHEQPASSRLVHFGDSAAVDCPVVMRDSLEAGRKLNGPMVVQEPDSTTLVWPGDELRVLDSGTLELRIGGAP